MKGGDAKIEETEQERALAQIAMQRFADYQNIFRPYEDKFMEEVEGMNTETKYQRASELAINPLASEFARQGVALAKGLTSQGVNPNSGKFKTLAPQLTGAQASAEVDASSRTTNTQQDAYVGGLQNVIAIGQGKATEATAGLTDVASNASRYAASNAYESASNRNNLRGVAGALLGAGTSYALNRKGG